MTERNCEELQQELKELSIKYETLLDNMSGGLVIMRGEKGCNIRPTYVSAGFCKMLGISQEETQSIYNADVFGGIHPDDERRVRKKLFRCCKRSDGFKDIYRLRGHGGKYFWVNVSANIVRECDAVNIYAVYTDIDELKKQELALALESYKTELALRHVDVYIWEYDIAGARSIFPKKFQREFGMPAEICGTPEQLVAKGWISPDSAEKYIEMHRKVALGAPLSEGDIHYVLPFGKDEWLRCSFYTVYDDNRLPVSAVGTAIPLSPVRRLEERYRRLMKTRTEIDRDAVGSFRLNLTKNWCGEGRGISDAVLRLQRSGTVDGFFAFCYAQILDEKQRADFREIFNRQALIKSFQDGQSTLSCENRYPIDHGRLEWINTKIIMMENPETHDIEGLIYSCSIERKKRLTALIDRFTKIEYEFLGVINSSDGSFSIESARDGCGSVPSMGGGLYDEVLARSLPTYFVPAELEAGLRDLSLATIKSELEKKKIYSAMHAVVLPSGAVAQKKWIFTPLDDDGVTIAFTRSDVTDIYNVYYDRLSGLSSRSSFDESARRMISEHPEIRFAVIIFDLDRFKVYNDLFGSAEGDRLLADIGAMFRGLPGEYAVHARLQADHFASCIPCEPQRIEEHIGRIREWLKNRGKAFNFVPRFGIYEVEDGVLDPTLMIDRAMLALRSIKGSPSSAAFYNESMRERLLSEQELLGSLENALRGDEFVIYMQPQYNHITGQLTGAEALVRWRRPDGTIVYPGAFIPVLEKNSLISKVDERVAEQACRLMAQWARAGLLHVPVSINLSRVDLYNSRLCEQLTELTDKYGIARSQLHLEITESAFMDDTDQLVGVLSDLRGHGFAIEMDDFGSGYSSLNTLSEVPVDMLKIDMKFIASAISNGRSAIIIDHIIKMAHAIDLPVIVEGVETK